MKGCGAAQESPHFCCLGYGRDSATFGRRSKRLRDGARRHGDVSPNPRKFRRRPTGSVSNVATVQKYNGISEILRWVSSWPDRPPKRHGSTFRKRCLVSSGRRHQSPALAWVATANFPEKRSCRENSRPLDPRRNFLGFGLTSPAWARRMEDKRNWWTFALSLAGCMGRPAHEAG